MFDKLWPLQRSICGLRRSSSSIIKTWLSNCLEVPIPAVSGFQSLLGRATLWRYNLRIGTIRNGPRVSPWAWDWICAFCDVGSTASTSRELVTRSERELFEAIVHEKIDLAPLQTSADGDCYMVHAAPTACTNLHKVLDAVRQTFEGFQRV